MDSFTLILNLSCCPNFLDHYRIIRKSTRKYNYDAPYSIIKRDSVMYFEYPIGYYDRGYKIYYVAEKCLIVFLDINS